MLGSLAMLKTGSLVTHLEEPLTDGTGLAIKALHSMGSERFVFRYQKVYSFHFQYSLCFV